MTAQPAPGHPAASGLTETDFAALNTTIRYTMYSVFSLGAPLPVDDEVRSHLVDDALAAVQDDGLEIRGWYDLGGLTAEADLLVWWHADSLPEVQAAYHRLRASELGKTLVPVWSVVGLHRPSEFNAQHVPSFLTGAPPLEFICVYPFVRSYDWYSLDPAERGQMLREHGELAAPYTDVLPNTVSTFGLSDYEWVLSFESDQPHRVVDLMRDLRNTRARDHVRLEVPFWFGQRLGLGEWADRQPLD
jgi:chlorite dismutase